METLKDYRNQVAGCNCDDPVNPWDRSYYRNQLLISKYQVDQELIREYLPMDQSLSGMLSIFEECLGVKYRKVENPSVWHEDVTPIRGARGWCSYRSLLPGSLSQAQ